MSDPATASACLVRAPGPLAAAQERERDRATTLGVVGDVADRDGVLGGIGRALSFPAHYGHNLDALEECLRDLDWLPIGPVVLVWDDTALRREAPALHAAVLDVLDQAAGASTDAQRPLRVVLVGPDTH